jgi:hypothetical protein
VVDFERLAQTAKRLIEANGRVVTLVIRSRSAAIAAQPWAGGATDTTTTVRAAFVPASSTGLGRSLQIDPGKFRRLSQVLLVAGASLPSAFDPEKVTRVIDNDRTYNVAVVDVLKPASTALLYSFGIEA